MFISAGELHQILSQDRHPSYSAEFYSSYVNILLGVFYSVCRDLRELRHLVRHTLISQWRFFSVIYHWFLFLSFFLFSTRLPSTFQSSVSRCQKEKVKSKDLFSFIWQLIKKIFLNTAFRPFFFVFLWRGIFLSCWDALQLIATEQVFHTTLTCYPYVKLSCYI